jgi:riboflavin kinase/FMN adenylyltransferase
LLRSVLTIGNFDGVHRAHQALLEATRVRARREAAPAVVLTFEPHPLTVVAPDRAPARLCTPEDKLRQIAQSGVDFIVVAQSEPQLLQMEAEDFVRSVAVETFHAAVIVEGPSFGFGRGRRGIPALLRELGPKCEFEVEVVEPVRVELGHGESVMVSSSLIRQLLAAGKVTQAATCLGRPYSLVGDVVHGHGRGKALGFPTVNLRSIDQVIPGEGVYAGRARLDSITCLAGISVGHNPTFGGDQLSVEAFLLDFDGNLYGRSLRLEFDRFLREQRRFPSAAALAQQLEKDIDAVRGTGNEAASVTKPEAGAVGHSPKGTANTSC